MWYRNPYRDRGQVGNWWENLVHFLNQPNWAYPLEASFILSTFSHLFFLFYACEHPRPLQPFKYLDNDNANQMPLTASTNGCRGILHDSTDNPPDKAYGYRIPLPFRPFDRQNRWTLIFFFRSYPKRKGNGESTWISSVITKNYENATAQVLEGCDGFLPKKRFWYTAAARGRIFNPFFFFFCPFSYN